MLTIFLLVINHRLSRIIPYTPSILRDNSVCMSRRLPTEVMNILDKCFYITSCRTNFYFFSRFAATADLVSRERFAKYFHERSISRQIYAVQIIFRINVLSGDIKPPKVLFG